jgi:hypothetical protein
VRKTETKPRLKQEALKSEDTAHKNNLIYLDSEEDESCEEENSLKDLLNLVQSQQNNKSTSTRGPITGCYRLKSQDDTTKDPKKHVKQIWFKGVSGLRQELKQNDQILESLFTGSFLKSLCVVLNEISAKHHFEGGQISESEIVYFLCTKLIFGLRKHFEVDDYF